MKDNSYMNYVGHEISPEQFIAEHTFVYIIKGKMNTYDGSRYDTLKSGECVLARKNRLARYNKEKVNGELEKIFVFFDMPFLKRFQEQFKPGIKDFHSSETLIKIKPNILLPTFIDSLVPHYNRLVISEPFSEIKRQELLLILLKEQPELTGLLFDFGIPEKINLEEFMNHNFKFNVSMERFAFLTGRSLSSFKRDFRQTFEVTPSRWLVKRRLQEAYFLIDKKNQKPSDFYLDLGFETLQHFSNSFKKEFGKSPSQLAG